MTRFYSSLHTALTGPSMKIPCNIWIEHVDCRAGLCTAAMIRVYILFASDTVTTKVEHYTQQC